MTKNDMRDSLDKVGDMLEGLLHESMEGLLEGEDLEAYRQVVWNMTNHTPVAADIRRIETLRTDFKVTAGGIIKFCPVGRERSLAITSLEQALMWAVAAIARQHPAPESDAGYSE